MNPLNVQKLDKLVEDMAEVKTDVKWLKGAHTDHKATHRAYNLKMFGAFLAALIAVIIAWLRS